MVSFYRKTLILLCLSALTCGMTSAKTLTLDECIELALKKNQDVIQARNQVKIASGNVWQAFGAFLPSISASATSSQTHRPSRTAREHVLLISKDTMIVPPDTLEIFPVESEVGGVSKSFSLGASANLTLFNGGQNIFNYLGAKVDRRHYGYLAESSAQLLILQVKGYYFAYLSSLKLLEISSEAVKRGEEQYKLAESRYEVGSAPKSDVLKAQVQYGNDKLDLLAAENDVNLARANLAYLIGVDVNADVDFSTEFESKDYDDTESEALKIGMANHPGLLASEYNLSAAKYDVRSTFGTYLPTLSVRLNRSWSSPTWSEVKKFRSEDGQWSINTTLSVPIFENFSRKRNMSRAKATLNNARASYHYAKNQVALGVKEAYLEITRAREALKVAEETVLAAQEDMSLVQEKYNLGAATILELLDAQVSLVTAQSSKVKAEFDYNLAVAELENAMGIR